MACRWQIRHKLMIGLGFVIGILSLVLLGTLKGLDAYRATTNSVDSKLVELHRAQAFKAAIHELAATPDPGSGKSSLDEDRALWHNRIGTAHQALADYQVSLQDTLKRHRDPDKGHKERDMIVALQERFTVLDHVVAEAMPVEAQVLPLSPSPENRNEKLSKAIEELDRAAGDLQDVIYDDLYRRIDDAKSNYKNTLIVVLSISVLGVLLMVGLLRFFYRWTFSPIRQLQQGVARVGEGDFENRIEVHSGDEMEALAGAFNDMTGRLREMYRDLARQVNERSRELVRSERLASVGFLAAGVAHEINNPLASIAFCSEALERRLFDNDERGTMNDEKPSLKLEAGIHRSSFIVHRFDEEVVTKYLKMIQEEAFRCKKITQRLLEFSRGGEHRREPTELGELVQAVLDVVQHLEISKGKQIVFKPSGSLVVWMNAQEIKSVVLNLVVNALESMDQGGQGTLTIALGRRDRMAELVFADTGCGMAPEVLENIFEPFFTRSRTGKGTGLGLSISHRVINQHGGEIEAVSPGVNQGSTFTVRLPLKPAEALTEEAQRTAA